MERMVDQSGKSGVTFNVISAHSNFSEDIQIERMVDRSGKPDERNSSNAQIRTLLEEQRQTIIAEYREKVSHHELHAAHAEEERRLPQGQLWRQKLEFREAHQRSLTEMEELRKFQSSTFDTIARRKLIEDQNTILVLSGRVQELQSEVNCMNDSKDFQDAESVHSGNSHVTSRPVSFTSPTSVQDDIGCDSPSLTCTLSSSSLDCDDLVRTLAPRALLQPPPGLEQYASPPGLAIDAHLCTPHGIPVCAAPLRPRLRSAISVTPPTAPCLYHPCGNTSCTFSYYRQEKC